MRAIETDDLNALRLLVTAQRPFRGIVHLVVGHSHSLDMLDYVVHECDADVEERISREYGLGFVWTPLQRAVYYGRWKMARHLISHCGANIWVNNGEELSLLTLLDDENQGRREPFDYALAGYLLRSGLEWGPRFGSGPCYPPWFDNYRLMRWRCVRATFTLLGIARYRDRAHRDVWGLVARHVWATRHAELWLDRYKGQGLLDAFSSYTVAVISIIFGALVGLLRYILLR